MPSDRLAIIDCKHLDFNGHVFDIVHGKTNGFRQLFQLFMGVIEGHNSDDQFE